MIVLFRSNPINSGVVSASFRSVSPLWAAGEQARVSRLRCSWLVCTLPHWAGMIPPSAASYGGRTRTEPGPESAGTTPAGTDPTRSPNSWCSTHVKTNTDWELVCNSGPRVCQEVSIRVCVCERMKYLLIGTTQWSSFYILEGNFNPQVVPKLDGFQ